MKIQHYLEKDIKKTLHDLSTGGSVAAQGFNNPEGIIIHHSAANSMFKVTIEGDESHKGDPRES